jgi:hypothetical protein
MTVTVNPQSDRVSPATPTELADFLGIDPSDTLLPNLLIAATDAAEAWLNRAIVEREYVAYWPDWPSSGAVSFPDLSLDSNGPVDYVELPYTGPATVTAVEVSETAFTAYSLKMTNPVRLYARPQCGDLSVTYDAGWPIGEVPTAIKSGIIDAAAYMYEHRGACDAQDALDKSGATGKMRRYKIELGF